MNDVKLSGRLVRDPELKHTPNPEDRPAGSVAAEYMENGGFEELDGEDGELPF